jgi:hypothetical protein
LVTVALEPWYLYRKPARPSHGGGVRLRASAIATSVSRHQFPAVSTQIPADTNSSRYAIFAVFSPRPGEFPRHDARRAGLACLTSGPSFLLVSR